MLSALVYLAYTPKTSILVLNARIFYAPNPHITRILGKNMPHNTQLFLNMTAEVCGNTAYSNKSSLFFMVHSS